MINVINLSDWQPAMSMNPNITEKQVQRSRGKRVLSICKQSKEQGFAVRFWEGIVEKQAMLGINKSFKKIVQFAKDENLPMVTIGEDDLLFSAPGAWEYYLEMMPEVFDIYSGGIYSGQIEGDRIVNGYSGNTLITVHERFYDFFLNINPNDHLDRALGNFAFEKHYAICIPFVVYQLEGYSDNHRRETRHSGYLKTIKEKLFTGKC